MRARTTPFSLDRHTEERLQHEIGLLGKRFVGKNAQFILEQQSSAKDYLPPGNHLRNHSATLLQSVPTVRNLGSTIEGGISHKPTVTEKNHSTSRQTSLQQFHPLKLTSLKKKPRNSVGPD